RTKRYPEHFLANISITGKYDSRATGETGHTYAGDARDWTGFGSSARSLPGWLQPTGNPHSIAAVTPLNPDGLSADELQQLGDQVATDSVYRATPGNLPP